MLKPIHFETRILDREVSSEARRPPGFQVSIRRQGSLNAPGRGRDGAPQQSLGQRSERHRGHPQRQGERPWSFQREASFHKKAEWGNFKKDSVQSHPIRGYEVQGELCIARDALHLSPPIGADDPGLGQVKISGDPEQIRRTGKARFEFRGAVHNSSCRDSPS